MDKSGKIVYLTQYNNLRGWMGLKRMLHDGWRVALVIRFDPQTNHSRQTWLRQASAPVGVVVRTVRRLTQTTPPEPKQSADLAALCAERGVPLIDTSDRSLKSLEDAIEAIAPDVILTNNWSYLVPPAFFRRARKMAVNVHGSYLPDYPGASSTYAELINGETYSGVSAHEMVERLDAGRILAQIRFPIERSETPETLSVKKAEVAGEVIVGALAAIGDESRYKPNPRGTLYCRANHAIYRRYKILNWFRKLVRLPARKLRPR